MSPREPEVSHYDAQYGQFASDLYAAIRVEAFGEDIGQNGWLTASEQDLLISWLALGPDTTLLDVACGSGAPTLRIANLTGCRVHGVDVNAHAIAAAQSQAKAAGLTARVQFDRLDAGANLPFSNETFDGVTCIDAVNHLPDRAAVFSDWARVLRPGGRLVFTDPIVVTGPLTADEIAVRSSIGFFLFVPAGVDEQMLEAAGFVVEEVMDRTENMAAMAERWHAARETHADALREVEGEETFSGQQRFFEVAARVAAERRLSRFAFRARRD